MGDRNVDKSFSFRTPFDFAKLFDNAEFVVTNSFHGTAFSINFGKQFITCPPTKNNPRFMSILRMLGLEDRVYDTNKPIEDYIGYYIDYDKINSILDDKRQVSVKFLFDTLKHKKEQMM